jgi:hypothetical protein
MPIEDDMRLERLDKEHESLCQALTGCTLSAHGSEVVIRTITPSQAQRLLDLLERLASE